MEQNKKTLEEAASNWFIEQGFNIYNHYDTRPAFIEGAKWQAERMYTEEDLRQAYNYGMFAVTTGRNFKDWFTNYKK